MSERLTTYVVYENPSDFPGEFVVRRQLVGIDILIEKELFGRGKSLTEVRALIPQGLFCVGRERDDDPVIVETWM